MGTNGFHLQISNPIHCCGQFQTMLRQSIIWGNRWFERMENAVKFLVEDTCGLVAQVSVIAGARQMT